MLPAISKILEKLINVRLTNYLNKYNILSKSQYGFRRGISTEDAITDLSSHIINKVDKNKKCLSIFLDLKKAFDTVSVPILVNVLERTGIRGPPLRLFSSYLHKRTQRVKLANYISEERPISYGVPQGSVLGPTLFLVYINELCNMSIDAGTVFTYADDTAVVFSGDTWEEVRRAAELGLARIARWLQTNLLTLNTAKTNFICFSKYNSSQPESDFSIRIHNCGNTLATCSCPSIHKAKHTRYLGVTVDQRLTWHLHAENIMNRIRKLIWTFKNLRHVLTKTTLNQVYISLAQSVITYAIPVWGGATKTKFLELERAQRALLKVMYHKPFRYPTSELYLLCDLLTVRKLYILNLVLKTHKKTIYTPGKKTSTRRRKADVINTPILKSAFARRQQHAQSCNLYNVINKVIDIHSCSTYECKSRLTKWLKSKTYTDIENLIK